MDLLVWVSVGWLIAMTYVAVAVWRRRAAYRALVLYTFTQHPIANTQPPTLAELGYPGTDVNL